MTFTVKNTINSNISIVYSSLKPYSISPKIPELIEKLNDLFERDVKPSISQMPDMTAIILPQQQYSIILNNRKLVVTDQSITKFESRNTEQLAKVTHIFFKILTGLEVRAYGYNVTLITNLVNDVKKTGELMIDVFLKDKVGELKTALGYSKLISSSQRLVFNKNKKRYDLLLEPEFDHQLLPTNRINVKQNTHIKAKSLPNESALIEEYSSDYQDILNNLNKVFS